MHSRRHNAPVRSAFTLIEVVVAMAFFSLAIGMLAQAANNALRAVMMTEEAQTREQDMLFLREQILKITDKTTLEAGGEITTPLSGEVSWEATVYPTTAADLFFVTLIFEFPESEKLPQATVTQTLYLYRPSWSDSGERLELMDNFEKQLDEFRPVRSEETQQSTSDS